MATFSTHQDDSNNMAGLHLVTHECHHNDNNEDDSGMDHNCLDDPSFHHRVYQIEITAIDIAGRKSEPAVCKVLVIRHEDIEDRLEEYRDSTLAVNNGESPPVIKDPEETECAEIKDKKARKKCEKEEEGNGRRDRLRKLRQGRVTRGSYVLTARATRNNKSKEDLAQDEADRRQLKDRVVDFEIELSQELQDLLVPFVNQVKRKYLLTKGIHEVSNYKS